MSNERIDYKHFASKFTYGTGQGPVGNWTKAELKILLDEIKRCYEEMDKVTQMIADFSHHCEQAEYTDVGEVWDLLNALMKNLASE